MHSNASNCRKKSPKKLCFSLPQFSCLPQIVAGYVTAELYAGLSKSALQQQYKKNHWFTLSNALDYRAKGLTDY